MSETVVGEGATDALPRVYRNKRHDVWFGKYQLDGRWKNKTVPVSIQDEDDAKRWFGAWLTELAATGVAPVNQDVEVSTTKTLRSLAPRWLKWIEATHPNDNKASSAARRLVNKYVLQHAIADIDIENELEIGHCTEWIEWLKTHGLAPLTVRNTVQGLRGFLVDVRGKGWARLRENPLLDPYVKRMLAGADTLAGRNTIIFLDAEQVAVLVRCDKPQVLDLRKVRNVVAIATGVREGELAAWTWDDFDLDAKVPVVKVFKQVQNQGSKHQQQWVLKPPKKNSHRVLPVHPTAVAALRWWKESGWMAYVGRKPEGSDIVFCTPDAGYTLSNFPYFLRNDLAVAGLPVLFDGQHSFTFHALRRTFMSLLEAAGVGRDLIGNLAGHAAKGVSDKHYIAKNIGRFAEAVNKLPLPRSEELSWLR